MKGLGDIKRRIGAVKSTQQITRAMKMVAAAKLRKAQERMEKIRPFDNEMMCLLTMTLEQTVGDEHRLLGQITNAGSVGLILVTADRGLCGAFNSNVLKNAQKWIEEHEKLGKTVKLFCVGRKGYQFFKRRGYKILGNYSGIYDKLDFTNAHTVVQHAIAAFESDEIDTVDMVYADFVSIIAQKIKSEKMLPIKRENLIDASDEATATKSQTVSPSHGNAPDYEIEGGIIPLFEQLLAHYLTSHLYRAMLESMAAEMGSRMTAMDAATKNAEDMIKRLTIQYNRARQEAITTELIEIVSGSAAMNG